MEAAAANGVTCLEWAGAKIVFEARPVITDDEDDFNFENDEEDDAEDEEYTDHGDDDMPEPEAEDEDDSGVKELEFKAPNSELPRPLQLNREYDNWTAALAPPVFSEKE